MTEETHWTEKPEERAEIERLTKLLSIPSGLLHSREKADAHIARLHFLPMPCWLCSCKVTVPFARGSAFHQNGETYNCLRCGVGMKYVVPFLDPRGWHWARPDAITPAAVVEACGLWLRNPA